MDLDATQAIPLDDWEDATQAIDLDDDSEDEIQKKPVAYLKLFTQKGVRETLYPVYEGDNKIGRHENIDISIPIKALSKQHACIQVSSDTHLIYDMDSRNKTKRNKMYLAPSVRYELRHEDRLYFADVTCQYLISAEMKTDDLNDGSETGSETGSESMFNAAEDNKDYENNLKNDANEEAYDENGDENSSDIIAPTQKSEFQGAKIELKTPKHVAAEATLCYAEDSDEDKETGSPIGDKDKTAQTIVKESPQVQHKGNPTFILQSDSDTDIDDSGGGGRKSPDLASNSSKEVDEMDISDFANAATQAVDVVEDSEDDDEEEEDKSIFCAATQAYGVADDEEDDEDECDEENNDDKKDDKENQSDGTEDKTADHGDQSVNMAEAATLAYGGLDDDDEDDEDDTKQPAEEEDDLTLAYNDTKDDDSDATDDNDEIYAAATQAYGIEADVDEDTEGEEKDPDLEPTQVCDGNNEDLESTQAMDVNTAKGGDSKTAVMDEDLQATQATDGNDGETVMLGDDDLATQVTAEDEELKGWDENKRQKEGQDTLMVGDDALTQVIEDVDVSSTRRSAAKKNKGEQKTETGSKGAKHGKKVRGQHGKSKQEAIADTKDESMDVDSDSTDVNMDEAETQVVDEDREVHKEDGGDDEPTQAMDDGNECENEEATQVIEEGSKAGQVYRDDGDDEPTQAMDVEIPQDDNQIDTKGVKAIDVVSQDKQSKQTKQSAAQSQRRKSTRRMREQADMASTSKDKAATLDKSKDGQEAEDVKPRTSGRGRRAKTGQGKSSESTVRDVEESKHEDENQSKAKSEAEVEHKTTRRGQRGKRGSVKDAESTSKDEKQNIEPGKDEGRKGTETECEPKTAVKGPRGRGKTKGERSAGISGVGESESKNQIEEGKDVSGKKDEGEETPHQNDAEERTERGTVTGTRRSVRGQKGKLKSGEDGEDVQRTDESSSKGGRRKSTRGRGRKAETDTTEEQEVRDVAEPGTSGEKGQEDFIEEETRNKDDLPSPDEDDLLACTQAYDGDDVSESAHEYEPPTSEDLTVETQVYGADTDEIVPDSEEDTEDDQDRGPLKIPSMLKKVPLKSAIASPKKEGSPKKIQKVAFNVKRDSQSSEELLTNQTVMRGKRNLSEMMDETEEVPMATQKRSSTRTRRSVATENKTDEVKAGDGNRRKSSRVVRTKHDSKDDGVVADRKDSVGMKQQTQDKVKDRPGPSTSNDDAEKDAEERGKVKATKQTNRRTRGRGLNTNDEKDTLPKEDTESRNTTKGRNTRGKTQPVIEEESLTPTLEDSLQSEEQELPPVVAPKRSSRGRKSVARETTENDEVSTVSKKKTVKRGRVSTKGETAETVQDQFKKPSEKITSGRLSKAVNVEDNGEPSQKKTVRRGSKNAVDDSVRPSTSKDEPGEEVGGSGKGTESSEEGTADTGRKTGRGRKASSQEAAGAEKASKVVSTPTSRPRRDTASPTMRRLSGSNPPKVMFTGVVDKAGEKTVKSLGGSLVDSVYECTHLVTDKVRRTVKFLCGLSRGIPILTPDWLDQCKQAKRFLDIDQYLLKDKQGEDQYRFDLAESRQKALQNSALQGYKVHVTKNVVPPVAVLKDIIQCAGGQHMKQMPKKSDENTFVVSCDQDKAVCQAAIKASIPIVNPECLLTGLLRQQIDLDPYRLFTDSGGQETTSSGKRKASETSSKGTTSKRRKK
ncbi:mediator of DNA damage checkpoint protein 1-like isoform X1 [Ptychodera flava]|uniref:mediator of DNA damage checkpoint protein 1-like isoform X1 n=1 Tax=Ptychodera flava TaxID=63121 RepID=UPI003969D235